MEQEMVQKYKEVVLKVTHENASVKNASTKEPQFALK
jgi:hypothetical protein